MRKGIHEAIAVPGGRGWWPNTAGQGSSVVACPSSELMLCGYHLKVLNNLMLGFVFCCEV